MVEEFVDFGFLVEVAEEDVVGVVSVVDVVEVEVGMEVEVEVWFLPCC